MSIATKFSSNNTIYTISINGDFNFSILDEFTRSYNHDSAINAAKVIVDMKNAETIDSSALGMMLSMQEYLNKEDGEISIVNSNSLIAKILKITNFGIKFSID